VNDSGVGSGHRCRSELEVPKLKREMDCNDVDQSFFRKVRPFTLVLACMATTRLLMMSVWLLSNTNGLFDF
jgi:hypothetical protein